MPAYGQPIDNAFTGWSGTARIEWPDAGWALNLHQADIPTDACLLVFRPESGPSFCVEPVTHPVDAIHLPGQPGLRWLEPGASMTLDLRWAFERLDMDGAVEGTGIGLALSRCLVDLMHGELGARSQPGAGSVFWLELPRSEPRVQAVPEAVPALPAASQAGQGDRHDVLYIEDNEVNQVLMEGMLAHRPGIGLRVATLPEEGLAMAMAQPPDLVLLDIQLPGVDGYEVLRRLRAHDRLVDTPVIAVSANAMPSDLARAQEAGFNGYLTKPLDMGRLLAAVDAALA